MNSDDFEFLSHFLRRRSGLALAPYKAHLVEGRLAPVARRFGFRNVESLLRELRYAREALARAVTEAMTTNDSSFFRELYQKFPASHVPDANPASLHRQMDVVSAQCEDTISQVGRPPEVIRA